MKVSLNLSHSIPNTFRPSLWIGSTTFSIWLIFCCKLGLLEWNFLSSKPPFNKQSLDFYKNGKPLRYCFRHLCYRLRKDFLRTFLQIKGQSFHTQRTQTSVRRLQDVLKRSRRLTTKPDVVTTSYRRLLNYDILKMSDLCRLENVRFTTFWRCPIYVVLKTAHLRRLVDVWLMTSWRHLIYDVLKTSVKWRLCSNVVATSIQRRKKWFFLIIFRKFWKVVFRLVFRYRIS